MPGSGAHLPPAAWSGDAGVFDSYLADSGQDYVLVGLPQQERVRVRFSGHFQGQPVVWDCEFVTLAAEYAERRKHRPGEVGGVRNFIEIGKPESHGVPLRVGLGVACTDRPAIEKMIIMIRNYKRLHPGRHEYGEPWEPLSPE